MPAAAFVGDLDCGDATADSGFPDFAVPEFSEIASEFSNEGCSWIADVFHGQGEKQRPVHRGSRGAEFHRSFRGDRANTDRTPFLFAFGFYDVAIAATGTDEGKWFAAFSECASEIIFVFFN